MGSLALAGGLVAAHIALKAELRPSRAQTARARQLVDQTHERAKRLYNGAKRRKQGGDPVYGELEDQAKGELARLLARLEGGDLTPVEWEAEMQAALAAYHQAAAMAGQKDTAVDADEVAAAVAGQFAYLRGFRDVVSQALAAGEAAWKAWSARAAMYAEAIGASFWRAFTGGWPLPAYPRDGTTQCLSHCHCEWRIEVIDQEAGDADAYWDLSPVEHCQTCIERARQWNPLRVRGGVLQE